MGVGDQVPPAIEQLGAKVEMISAEDLAWGNLSRFDAIVTGVRAYERRADLRANNSRLLEYVFNGGTVIVQYNKFEFNDAQYGPYPAQVSSNRVTDEFSPGPGRSTRAIRCSRRRTRSAKARGRTGCRSADCISWAKRIRATRISSSSRIRFRTTRARRPARWSRRDMARAMGLRRAGPVAAAAGGDGGRVPAAGESDFARRSGSRFSAEIQISDFRLISEFGRLESNNQSKSDINLKSEI